MYLYTSFILTCLTFLRSANKQLLNACCFMVNAKIDKNTKIASHFEFQFVVLESMIWLFRFLFWMCLCVFCYRLLFIRTKTKWCRRKKWLHASWISCDWHRLNTCCFKRSDRKKCAKNFRQPKFRSIDFRIIYLVIFFYDAKVDS